MPQQPSRAHSQKDLPPSVETAYYRKCIDIRRRITDIEDSNDSTRQRILRLNRGVQKMRLERAFLLEQLNKHMEYNIDDSDRSSSPPPTPTDKPLRSKRGHGGRKEDGGMGGRGGSGQSTPERSMPGAAGGGGGGYYASPATAQTATQNVNGVPVLPPLHSLPQLQPQVSRAYFDPAYDEQRTEDAGRRRAYSGAQMPQNGDTEMADVGFAGGNP
ncbi:hypothetical protein CC86DRAFT_459054 [Ophiobolus disseminans]|uniref:INO80 complex subunit F domain-containing protein n=1 Tax=Ophiobolus disseminans TaxID=1469910 RepID=A0A6A6ZKC2_9PLEO|nr:hypothetical protein CC86DRAFT_459054 [Ophiobolus disseminans]